MAVFKLRDYQEEAIDSPINYWESGKKGNPLIIAPTAAGKSIIIGGFSKKAYEQFPNTRIVVLTHSKELVEQNEAELKDFWFEAPTGVYSASAKRKEMDMPITFASIQTIYKKAFDFEAFDLIIVDECHMIPKKGSGMYRTFIDNCKKINKHVKVIGLTASPFRLDGGSLLNGDGRIFDDVCYNITVTKLLTDGYISPLTAKEGIVHIETNLLKSQSGEYTEKSQYDAFHKNNITEKCIDEVIKLGQERKSWMIFCSSVKHAQEVSDMLNAKGIKSACVHGGTKNRDEIINAFKRFEIRCLVSVNVLTTGFNVKQVDLIALMRSTKSASLYYQILGRGMRLYPGKENCLVLDYGENILRHGPVDEIVERQLAKGEKKKGKPQPPVMKRCEKCGAMAFASVRQCACGALFPVSTLPKIQQQAARLAVLSSERKKSEEEIQVDEVFYRLHKKEGMPDSIKVEYICKFDSYCEWVCLDHQGGSKRIARNWWLKRTIPGSVTSQPTVEEALEFLSKNQIKTPKSIVVKKKGKYSEIVRYNDLNFHGNSRLYVKPEDIEIPPPPTGEVSTSGGVDFKSMLDDFDDDIPF